MNSQKEKKLNLLILILLLSPINSITQPINLVEKIAISVIDSSREFAFTNKEDAYFYSETNAYHRSSWQGFNVFGREYLEDYAFKLNDILLDRKFTKLATVFPYQIRRVYENEVLETLTLLDSLPVLILELTLPTKQKISFIPLVSDFKRKSDFIIDLKDNTLLITRKNHTKRTEKQNYPVYLGIYLENNFDLIGEQVISSNFSPSGIELVSNHVKIAIGVGDDDAHLIKTLKHSFDNSDLLIMKRKERMEKILQDTYVQSENEQFDRALMWAKISMDALIMNQVTKGIFAGLPWFNNYWGRDSFISLPGATLVTGNYSEARTILISFAKFQEKDERNINYGRIPNIITTTHKSYNTADGTPRFAIAAYEYFKYSGDKNFVREIFPYLERAINGSLKYRTDKYYFLTHDDADTWMDAVGPDGPWTPRGNRANDVQALWYSQLVKSAEFAKILGKQKLAENWFKIADTLKFNFNKFFVDSLNGFVYDHINTDDSQDLKNRPNQIFCTNLLNENIKFKVLKNVLSNLTFEYGVASLSQDDEQFHPYHQNPPYYVKDAAYHQGTVWTWLSGPVVSELCYFNCAEKAYTLTQNLVHQILNRGAVGTISELLDAHPRKENEEPALSGTFSQAWSLAEFIRNFYQDYLNINFDFKTDRKIFFKPNIPKDLGNIKARIKFGDEFFDIIYLNKTSPSVKIENINVTSPITFIAQFNVDDNCFSYTTKINRSSKISLSTDNSKNKNWKISHSGKEHFKKNLMNTPFAIPRISSDFAVMKPPPYKLLNNEEVKKYNADAKNILNLNDPAYDDTGFSGYKYPLNPNFIDGILDLLNFKVDFDEQNVYFSLKFRKLHNPGWHPEYGFQLTYIAIAIDQDGIINSGKRDVGMNSKYLLNETEAFEKIIYVGGGIRVDDTKGTIAYYVPVDSDIKNPLGDISSATINFSLPTEIIGKPDEKWNFVVLVGAQDDHGGAGLGDFRNVDEIESEWAGGGKKHPELPNVYDILSTH